MSNAFIENIKEGNFNALKGSRFHLNLPFTQERLNKFLKSAAQKNSAIEKVEIIKILDDLIYLQVSIGQVNFIGSSFEIIDRELIVKLHPVLKKPNFLLRIEVVDGLRRIENEILEILFNTIFENDTVDFANRTILINHSEFSDNPFYVELINSLESAKLHTHNDQVEYELNFSIK